MVIGNFSIQGTVRRFLEHWGKSFEAVVFCLDEQEDYDIYNTLLPIYFPRTIGEVNLQNELLPKDIGWFS